MPGVDWVPVAASIVLIAAGLLFMASPTWAVALLDFARLALGNRDMARGYRNRPPEVSGPIATDAVARSSALKLNYRIGGALMTLLGVLLLLRAPGN